MIKGRLRTWSMGIFLSVVGEAFAIENSWYFSAEQIEVAYRYQQNFGSRLQSPLKPHDCYYGKTEFVAWFQGNDFLAPCRFIHQTTRHLKTMLEKGAARYLFPLDADHVHLAVPIHLWRDIYGGLNRGQLVPRILRDPALVALYHTAEHLAAVDRKNAALTAQVKKWRDQRNVLAFYDGRPLKILPPHPDGSGHKQVEDHQTVVTIFFLAHRLGRSQSRR